LTVVRGREVSEELKWVPSGLRSIGAPNDGVNERKGAPRRTRHPVSNLGQVLRDSTDGTGTRIWKPDSGSQHHPASD
jgi:hypothetical protein